MAMLRDCSVTYARYQVFGVWQCCCSCSAYNCNDKYNSGLCRVRARVSTQGESILCVKVVHLSHSSIHVNSSITASQHVGARSAVILKNSATCLLYAYKQVTFLLQLQTQSEVCSHYRHINRRIICNCIGNQMVLVSLSILGVQTPRTAVVAVPGGPSQTVSHFMAQFCHFACAIH